MLRVEEAVEGRREGRKGRLECWVGVTGAFGWQGTLRKDRVGRERKGREGLDVLAGSQCY